MTTEELNDLAKSFEDAMVAAQATKTEAMMVVGLLQNKILLRILRAQEKHVEKKVYLHEDGETGQVREVPPPQPPHPREPIVDRPPKETPIPKRSIKYDPVYDPPPPMSGDPLPPPQGIATGKVIGKAGQACICSVCNCIGYTITRDITDGCKIIDFIGSFKSYAEAIPPISRSTEIQNIEGNISIDCPACGAAKALYLIGRKSNVSES